MRHSLKEATYGAGSVDILLYYPAMDDIVQYSLFSGAD